MEEKQLNNNSALEIKELKAKHKAKLKELASAHDAELAEIKVKQAEELATFKNNQVEQKATAKAVKKQVKLEYAEYKQKQQSELQEFTNKIQTEIANFEAQNSNLVDIYNFTNEKNAELDNFKKSQKEAFMFFDSKEKNKVNKVNLNWKNEVIKYRIDQFEQYHTVEERLRYDEYLLEQSQKAELAELTGENTSKSDSATALVDADKEHGNPVVLFFKHLWRDMKVTLGEKPSIIFGLLVMVTGVIFGFTIGDFVSIANKFSEEYAVVGLLIFIFEMAGMLNLVNGFGMCTSRTLKSVIMSTLTTILILGTGIAWMYLVKNKLLTAADPALVSKTNIVLVICMVTSLVGSIGGYFTYDKENLQAKR